MFNDPHINSIFTSLIIATLLGMSLGIERVYAQKTAGMRTYALISMASALFVVISTSLMDSGANFESAIRLASQVIPGVGFIGAGIIILHKDKVINVTTATAIWVAAGIGMAAGFGMYSLAIFATILTLLVLEGLSFIERTMKNRLNNKNNNFNQENENMSEDFENQQDSNIY